MEHLLEIVDIAIGNALQHARDHAAVLDWHRNPTPETAEVERDLAKLEGILADIIDTFVDDEYADYRGAGLR
jgi:hypothetical protein